MTMKDNLKNDTLYKSIKYNSYTYSSIFNWKLPILGF